MSVAACPSKSLDNEVESGLRSLLLRGEAEILANDSRFRHLYDSGLETRPLFCFGRVPASSYFTIGANPSADDFRAQRWTSGDLASLCFSYFDRVVPHDYFRNWEDALSPLYKGLSYKSGEMSHLDVSPRATKSLRAVNKCGNTVINDFLTMARGDASYLFAILALVWPQARGLFAGGTITKKKYIDEFLAEVGPSHGFRFQHRRDFTGRAGGPRSRSKIYDVTFRGRSVPLFFCHVGASADSPGDQAYFRSQVQENVDHLRPLFFGNSGHDNTQTQQTPRYAKI